MTWLVCGEALYDVFVDQETPAGFMLDARIGGSAFNVAVGLARLGLPAGLLTGVGTDPLGDRLARELAAAGVDTGFLRRKDRRTTLALVALGPDGGARYAFYGEDAADRALTADDLPAPDGLRGLLFGCFSLLTRPTGDSFLSLARAAAGAADRPLITLDPNIRPTVEPDMAIWRDRVDAFAACADLVKVSAEDLAALRPGEAAQDVAARWLAQGRSLVVVTDGAAGATAHGRFGAVHAPAPAVEVADTVGAGDGFLAALVCALHEAGRAAPAALATMDARGARRALDFAVAAAARICARRGAALPTRAELGA